MKIIANGKEIDGERFNSIYIDKEADPGYAVLTIVLFGGEEIPVATYTLDEICMAWYMLKRIARSVLVFDESIDVEAVAHVYPSEEIMEKFNIDYGTRDEIRLLKRPWDEEVKYRVNFWNSIYENYMKARERREV